MGMGIVHTQSGDVCGTELQGKYHGITYFKGIPYAAPPVGALRWRPPLRPWRNIDYQMADMVSSYWVNFIATGDVNGSGLPNWPAFGGNCGWMNLLTEPVPHEGMDSDEGQLLYAYVKNTFGV